MFHTNWLDLQFFAGEGASSGDGGAASGASSAAAGQSTGETTAAAGQAFEDRLEQLGVPKNMIRKGAYKGSKAEQAAQKPPAAAPAQAQEQKEAELENGAASRKSWEEIKADYKDEFTAEMTSTVQQRLKKERDLVQQYADREGKAAPMLEFLAKRYGMDPGNYDIDELVKRFREDTSLSQERALEMGASDEVANKLNWAELDEARNKRAEEARKKELAEAFQRQQWTEHIKKLRADGAALAAKIPGFNFDAEWQNPEFRRLTDPFNNISVEVAYYALHPEVRQAEAVAAAKKATEAVSASVMAGAARPVENGAQAASVGGQSFRNMSKADREALKKRIYDAGSRGEHLPFGG